MNDQRKEIFTRKPHTIVEEIFWIFKNSRKLSVVIDREVRGELYRGI